MVPCTSVVMGSGVSSTERTSGAIVCSTLFSGTLQSSAAASQSALVSLAVKIYRRKTFKSVQHYAHFQISIHEEEEEENRRKGEVLVMSQRGQFLEETQVNYFMGYLTC